MRASAFAATVAATLRKDVARTWPLLAMVYTLLSVWAAALRITPPSDLNVGSTGIPWSLQVALMASALWHLAGMVAAGWVVLEDPPAAREPFWATRPLSRNGLLVAKTVFLGGVLWLPMLLARRLAWSGTAESLAWQSLAGGWGGDLLLLCVGGALAGFAVSLTQWVRLGVGFAVLAYLFSGPAAALLQAARRTYLSSAAFLPASISILVVAMVLLLRWRYRRTGLPGWVRRFPSALRATPRPRGAAGSTVSAADVRGRSAPFGVIDELSHHLRKDLWRLWPVLVALVLLLGLRLVEVLPPVQLDVEPIGSRLRLSIFGNFWLGFVVLVASGLAVIQDTPRGSEPFWATRPMRPGCLAGAKAAFAGGCVLAAILVAEAVALVAYDLDPVRLPAALAEAALSMAVPVALGLAIGALVERASVWLVVLVLLPTGAAGSGLLRVFLDLFLDRQASLTGWLLGHSVALGLGCLVLAGAYRRWRLRSLLRIAGGGFLVVVFAQSYWPWDFLQPWLRHRGAPHMAVRDRVTAEVPEPESRHMSWNSGDPGVPIQVPIAVHGLLSGVAVRGEIEHARLESGPKTISGEGGSIWFGDEPAVNAATGDLRRLDQTPRMREHQKFGRATLLYLQPAEYRRFAGRPAIFHGRLRLAPYRYVEHAELPFDSASGARSSRGSYRFLVLDVDRSSPGFEVVEQDLVLRLDGNGSGPAFGLEGVELLVDRRRREAVRIDHSRIGDQLGLGIQGSQRVALESNRGAPLVTPSPGLFWTRFGAEGEFSRFWNVSLPHPGWVDESSLLWLKRVEGRPIEIELRIEDLVLPMGKEEEWLTWMEEVRR